LSAERDPAPLDRDKIRLDQWLWFARFTKSRSLAGRLCVAGAISVNGASASKANQSLRVGDVVIVPQGGWQHAIRVLALGARRGPAAEARLLYDEITEAVRLRGDIAWEPLLAEEAQEE
jgi:ribosome-associated heat shock protein Hsp15